MSALALAPGVKLPEDAITETFGWLGNRGSGKTYGAKRMAEVLLHTDAQVVVLDPVDAWWGLRHGKVKGEHGLSVYVFGGEHGDLALEDTASKLLADVVVERGVSAVFSLRHLPKARQRRFVKDFAEQLYLRKGEERYRTAVHVFIEEAHTFAPQGQIKGEDFGCLGAVQDLVMQGRSSGIGVSLITQRVATLSRSVLELAEVLCAFRTTGPNARKALSEWFKAQDGEDHLAEFLGAIPGLPRGKCWVWSPGYLNLFTPAEIPEGETFDSSATPAAGKPRPRPAGQAAALDLGELGQAIADTVERQKADDPKALRAKVAELERQIAYLEAQPVKTVLEAVKVPYVPPDLLEALQDATVGLRAVGMLQHTFMALEAARDTLVGMADKTEAVVASMLALPGSGDDRRKAPLPPASLSSSPVPAPPSRPPSRKETEDARLDTGHRRVLTALAQYPMGLGRKRLSALTGYAWSGGFRNYLSALRTAGYITGTNQSIMVITEAGLARLGERYEPLPTGRALLDYWLAKLSGPERKILSFLVECYPKEWVGPELADACGYEWSGGFRNYLSSLRTLELIVGANLAGMRASDEFMEAIR